MTNQSVFLMHNWLCILMHFKLEPHCILPVGWVGYCYTYQNAFAVIPWVGLSFLIFSIAKSWVHKHSRHYRYCILDQITLSENFSAILVYWMNKEDTQYPQQLLTLAKLIAIGMCNIQHIKLIFHVFFSRWMEYQPKGIQDAVKI